MLKPLKNYSWKPSIVFTMEVKTDGKLHFLNVLIEKTDNKRFIIFLKSSAEKNDN